jgi:hypothetical protein
VPKVNDIFILKKIVSQPLELVSLPELKDEGSAETRIQSKRPLPKYFNNNKPLVTINAHASAIVVHGF